MNLCTKTEPVTAGANVTVNVGLLGTCSISGQKKQTYVHHCIQSSRDRLGFYEEIRSIFWDSVRGSAVQERKTLDMVIGHISYCSEEFCTVYFKFGIRCVQV